MAVLATFDRLKAVRDRRQFAEFVWPDEYWNDEGILFSKMTHEPDIEVEPLLVDMQTANCMMTVYDALNEKNQAKFRDWVGKTRAHFGRLVELSWSAVK